MQSNISRILCIKLLLYKYHLSRCMVHCDASQDTKEPENFDLVVIGGGIIGTACARHVKKQYPKFKVALVEKEKKLAQHQTGHNSGVLHAGIYYTPGTLKAKLCVKGVQMMYKYLDEKKIPYKKCGKLIVATNERELSMLDTLYQRALANKVPDVRMVEGREIKTIEPNGRGLKAIYSPNTGIVDFATVTESLAHDFREADGKIFFNFKVNKFCCNPDPDYPIVIQSCANRKLKARHVVTCAGLYADYVAGLSGGCRDPAIIPFRGEYLLVKPEFNRMVRVNIYPVPDPNLPFLGVHFTKRLDDGIWLGPNAVLAFSREGYKWSNIRIGELFSTLTYPGFYKLAFKHFRAGVKEIYKSIFLGAQVRDLERYVNCLNKSHVTRGPSGVRAQALSRDGELIEDFIFEQGKNRFDGVLHVRNAPSPGATSSMAIAEMITEKLEELYRLSELNKSDPKPTSTPQQSQISEEATEPQKNV